MHAGGDEGKILVVTTACPQGRTRDEQEITCYLVHTSDAKKQEKANTASPSVAHAVVLAYNTCQVHIRRRPKKGGVCAAGCNN